jgi:hypothetical protein
MARVLLQALRRLVSASGWGADRRTRHAIDGIRAALESRPAELEKSGQRRRLAQQH